MAALHSMLKSGEKGCAADMGRGVSMMERKTLAWQEQKKKVYRERDIERDVQPGE